MKLILISLLFFLTSLAVQSVTIPDRDELGNTVTEVTNKPLSSRDNHTFDGQGFMKNCITALVCTISYTIINEADMSGVEILGAEIGDKVQMQVVDTPTGAYSLALTGTAVPNAVLNQYGTNWYVRPNVFLKVIPYGARVMPGMVITFLYQNNGVTKNIYINLDLHKIIDPI